MNEAEGFVILLTYLAVIASGISGALEARKHEMDVVGATTVAYVTAFGGGTLRDLLLESVLIVRLQAGLACVANWQYTPYFRWILGCARSRAPGGDNGLTIRRFVRRPSGAGALENL